MSSVSSGCPCSRVGRRCVSERERSGGQSEWKVQPVRWVVVVEVLVVVVLGGGGVGGALQLPAQLTPETMAGEEEACDRSGKKKKKKEN
ncbi:hypothetical protein EYF80_050207 [Liparis tanakae]|uniref:Uncharacterized protein n=1 Tax=Liparis tanakae TaxID=230148 RepID=A0A4Z2FGY9_9TELE|nr:hypothetical protein EYF80_050207 [Liparis tanakae]